MSLSKLNHDCFLGVMGHCALSTQLQLRLVSTNWCNGINSQLRRTRCLALIEADQPLLLNLIKSVPRPIFPFTPYRSLFLVPSTLSSAIPLLFHLFPFVEKLLLITDTIAMAPLEDYLSSLSGSLSSLAILNHRPIIDWAQLERLPKLTRFLSFKNPPEPHIGPILHRLEYFASPEMSADTLSYLGPNLRWLQIGHHNAYSETTCIPIATALQRLPEQTKSRLEHLAIHQIGNKNVDRKVYILENFCCTFPNLKSLHFLDSSVPFDVLIYQANLLPNLRKLIVSRETFEKAMKDGLNCNYWTREAPFQISTLDRVTEHYTI